MKRSIIISGLIGFCYLVLINIFPAANIAYAGSPASIPSLLSSKPIYGWRVCGDLGVGPIPGVGSRQRFKVCQGSGWISLAYCTETNKTAPPMGTMCSFVSATNLWCGDSYQLLQEYVVLATAAPTPTSTATPTSTSTPTPTRTLTSTPTQTRSPTPTSTVTASATLTPTFTSTATVVPSRVITRSSRFTATPAHGGAGGKNQRPRPGGPGNLEWTLAAGAMTLIILLASGGVTWRTLRGLQAYRRQEKGPDEP